MKVQELIECLSRLDGGLDVYFYEGGPVPLPGGYPGPFDVADVSAVNVRTDRVNGTPVMQFVGESEGRPVAVIGITADL